MLHANSAKRITQEGLARLGYEVRRLRHPGGPPHDGARMDGLYIRLGGDRYCPWLVDEPFRQAHAAVREHTAVDEHRLYELWQLAQQAAKLPDGDVIEVGVWQGGSGCLIARALAHAGTEPAVFLCDTFRGVVKAGPLDPYFVGGEYANTSPDIVRGLADRLGLRSVHVLEGVFPEDTGHLVADRRFRLCHVDVDVYRSAQDVTEWLWERVVPGGIVVYDDFGFSDADGVTRCVEDQRGLPDRLVVHNLNGHGIVVKQR